VSISGSVSRLATLLANHARVAEPSAEIAAFLRLVGEMPVYARRQRLEDWEEAVCALADGIAGSEQPLRRCAWELFQLGRMNLYGAIDQVATEKAYRQLLEAMGRLGVRGLPDPAGVRLGNW
jgi:hypothetical protein